MITIINCNYIHNIKYDKLIMVRKIKITITKVIRSVGLKLNYFWFFYSLFSLVPRPFSNKLVKFQIDLFLVSFLQYTSVTCSSQCEGRNITSKEGDSVKLLNVLYDVTGICRCTLFVFKWVYKIKCV